MPRSLNRALPYSIGSGVRTHYESRDSLHYTHKVDLQTLYCIRVLDRASLLHYRSLPHCSLCHYRYTGHCLCAFGLVHYGEVFGGITAEI